MFIFRFHFIAGCVAQTAVRMRLISVVLEAPALFLVLHVLLVGNGHHVFDLSGDNKSLEKTLFSGESSSIYSLLLMQVLSRRSLGLTQRSCSWKGRATTAGGRT